MKLLAVLTQPSVYQEEIQLESSGCLKNKTNYMESEDTNQGCLIYCSRW